MEMIEVIGLILMIVGFILAVVEMCIPGFGIPGISGIICMVVGVVLKAGTLTEGLVCAGILLAALAIAMTIVVVIFHSKKLGSPIALKEEMKAENNFLSAEDMEYLLGRKGMTTTDLRPAGKVDIDGVEFDVRSETRYIEKGTEVTIIRIQSGNIIVK